MAWSCNGADVEWKKRSSILSRARIAGVATLRVEEALAWFRSYTVIAVEISSSEAPVRPELHTVQASGIELHHRRGWSLIVAPGFDASHLRRLLSVLEQEP